jgi:hypothetical protein
MTKCETCGEKRESKTYTPLGTTMRITNCPKCLRVGAYPLWLAEAQTDWWAAQITYKDGRYMTVAEALAALEAGAP